MASTDTFSLNFLFSVFHTPKLLVFFILQLHTVAAKVTLF